MHNTSMIYPFVKAFLSVQKTIQFIPPPFRFTIRRSSGIHMPQQLLCTFAEHILRSRVPPTAPESAAPTRTRRKCDLPDTLAAFVRNCKQLFMYCQVGGTSQQVPSFNASDVADFADWLALRTYLAQFHSLLLNSRGSYSSLTRMDPLESSYMGKS